MVDVTGASVMKARTARELWSWLPHLPSSNARSVGPKHFADPRVSDPHTRIGSRPLRGSRRTLRRFPRPHGLRLGCQPVDPRASSRSIHVLTVIGSPVSGSLPIPVFDS
jgi:hypothetical protein